MPQPTSSTRASSRSTNCAHHLQPAVLAVAPGVAGPATLDRRGRGLLAARRRVGWRGAGLGRWHRSQRYGTCASSADGPAAGAASIEAMARSTTARGCDSATATPSRSATTTPTRSATSTTRSTSPTSRWPAAATTPTVVGHPFGTGPDADRRTFVIAEAHISYRTPAFYGEPLFCARARRLGQPLVVRLRVPRRGRSLTWARHASWPTAPRCRCSTTSSAAAPCARRPTCVADLEAFEGRELPPRPAG